MPFSRELYSLPWRCPQENVSGACCEVSGQCWGGEHCGCVSVNKLHPCMKHRHSLLMGFSFSASFCRKAALDFLYPPFRSTVAAHHFVFALRSITVTPELRRHAVNISATAMIQPVPASLFVCGNVFSSDGMGDRRRGEME